MQLLDQITITRPGKEAALIQLLQGDLTALPQEHAADILIISAYPGSYVPVEKTLIAALDAKGISIETLAMHKAIDLRDQLGCWLSQPLTGDQQAKFNFKRILCFEPWQQTTDQASAVGNIFRCINTFAFNENNNVIAMPVLASGKQKMPVEKMLPALLDTSIFWMESGLPLNCIKLVLFSDGQARTALPVFTRAKRQNELKQSLRSGKITGAVALGKLEIIQQEQLPGEENMQIAVSEIKEMAQREKKEKDTAPGAPAKGSAGRAIINTDPPLPSCPPAVLPPAAIPPPAQAAPAVTSAGKQAPLIKDNPHPPATGETQYDYFVSYAHKHAAIIDAFVNDLTAANKDLQIFYDKSSIPAGGLWIKQISDAIQKAKKILIFLSPDYSNSPVCWDEFQCAKLIEYNSKKQIIQTIYLYNDISMPPIMGIYSWTDCREGDIEKLRQTALQLLEPAT